jgi:uncharacterized membrane protein YvlD (DUF360 family)
VRAVNEYGADPVWEPAKPKWDPLRLVVSWALAALAVYIAAGLAAGVQLDRPGAAFLVAAVIAAINAVVPPLVAALRLPFTLIAGFFLILFVDGAALVAADEILPSFITVNSWGDALLASLVIAAVSIVIEVLAGTNDDDQYTVRVVRRVARRQGPIDRTDAPGVVFLEIDGLALPVLQRAMPRTWPDGWVRTATGSPSGSPTSPRRRAPARRASCSALTRTFRPSAGSRRRAAG